MCKQNVRCFSSIRVIDCFDIGLFMNCMETCLRSIIAQRPSLIIWHQLSNSENNDMSKLEYFDKNVLNKYNTAGPRYTSYPTALSFHDEFSDRDFEFQIKQKSTSKSAQHLSLYLHIPFCHSLCYYCGCNKIVTRHKHKADHYLEYLFTEITHRGASIEIDPREIELSYIDDLADIGFNRLSIGVQDINKEVQEKINRVQSTTFIASLVARAKELGFSSINLDLIYGLPMQTFDTFLATLQKVIDIDPDCAFCCTAKN